MSEVWKVRREKLFVLPGDSPIGFRLPIGSLPYITEVQYPHVIPMDPHAAHAALPAKEALLSSIAANPSPRARN